jgi:FkbM family methyltransferase
LPASPLLDRSPFGTHAPARLIRAILGITRRLPRHWLGLRVAFLLRKFALKLLDGKPVDVETLGVRMRLMPYRNICEKRILFTPQFFDAQERELLIERIDEGFVFLDIGANVGAYALSVAAQAGPGARILAIEPQPEIFDRLTFNIAQNPLGTIKALSCALADKPGELTLFLDPKNRGESSVKMLASGHTEAIRVPALTLMDLLREENLTRIDAAKLDVEGAEDLILLPFLKEAPSTLLPKLLILENGEKQWQDDLPGILQRTGYRLLLRTRMNMVWERD